MNKKENENDIEIMEDDSLKLQDEEKDDEIDEEKDDEIDEEKDDEIDEEKDDKIDDTMKIDSLEEILIDDKKEDVSVEKVDTGIVNNNKNILWIVVSLLSILLIIVLIILLLSFKNESNNTSNDNSNKPIVNNDKNDEKDDDENKVLKYSFKTNTSGTSNIIVNEEEYKFEANSYSNIRQYDDMVLFVANYISSKELFGITNDKEVINFSCSDHEKLNRNVHIDRFYNTSMCDNFKISYNDDSIVITSDNNGQDVLGIKQCPTGDSVADITEKFNYLGKGKFSAPVVQHKTLCKDRKEYDDIIKHSIAKNLAFSFRKKPNSVVGESFLIVGDKEYDFNATGYGNFRIINDALFFNTFSPSGIAAKGVTATGETINFACDANQQSNKNYDINITTKNCNNIKLSFDDESLKITSSVLGNGGLLESSCSSKDDVIETVEKFEYLGQGNFSKPMVIDNITCKNHLDYDKVFGNNSKLDYTFKTILPKGNNLGGDNIIIGGKEFKFLADKYDQIQKLDDLLFFRVIVKDSSSYYAVDGKGNLFNFGNDKAILPSINIKTKLNNNINITINKNVFTITSTKFSNGGFVASEYKPDEIVKVIEEVTYLGNGKFSENKLIKEIKSKDYLKHTN